MLLPTILLLIAGAAAWTVPEHFGNGVYEVSLSDSGEHIHTFIANITDTKFDPTSLDAAPLVSRWSSAKTSRDLIGPNNIFCANVGLVKSDTDNANNNIDFQCGNGNPLSSQKDKYAIFNNVVSYVCNFSNSPNNCFSSERKDADKKISATCGLYIAGDDTVPDRSICYGYQVRVSNFCGRGI